MPLFDFKCPTCGEVAVDVVVQYPDLPPILVCDMHRPQTIMVRQPAAPAFTIKGYNAANGYSVR